MSFLTWLRNFFIKPAPEKTPEEIVKNTSGLKPYHPVDTTPIHLSSLVDRFAVCGCSTDHAKELKRAELERIACKAPIPCIPCQERIKEETFPQPNLNLLILAVDHEDLLQNNGTEVFDEPLQIQEEFVGESVNGFGGGGSSETYGPPEVIPEPNYEYNPVSLTSYSPDPEPEVERYSPEPDRYEAPESPSYDSSPSYDDSSSNNTDY